MKARCPIVDGAPVPLAVSERRFKGDDDVWYRWAVFSRKAVEAERGYPIPVFDASEILDWVWWLTGWHYSYYGPGRYFSDVPSVRVVRDHILIVQRCGYDV